jgi:hypothetical protein
MLAGGGGRLVFIHGPAAAGKLTVARELAAISGLPVFHNHLVVDALLAVFPFGDPAFVKLREEMWMAVFAEAAKAGRSMIFTFQPEPTVDQSFPARAAQAWEAAGGRTAFVRLTVSRDVQEARLANVSRAEFRKLTSLDLLRDLRPGFEAAERAMPEAGLTIATDTTAPNEAARRIADWMAQA